MAFLLALTRPKEKTLRSQYSGMLVKMLRKRLRVFLSTCLLYFVYSFPVSNPIRSERRGKEETAALLSPFPQEKETEDYVARHSCYPLSLSRAPWINASGVLQRMEEAAANGGFLGRWTWRWRGCGGR